MLARYHPRALPDIADRVGARVAIHGAAQINIKNAAGGDIDYLPVPGRKPTDCTFDVAGSLGLIVTEAEHGEVLSFPDWRSTIAPWRGA